MAKFTGFIINKQPSRITETLRGLWIKLTKIDGQPFVDHNGEVYTMVVDCKDLASNWDAVRGLTQGSLVAIEAESVCEHNPGQDRIIPAKGKYPAQAVHQLYNYTRGSLTVLKAHIPMDLARKADDAAELATPEELKALADKVAGATLI